MFLYSLDVSKYDGLFKFLRDAARVVLGAVLVKGEELSGPSARNL
jgi:hypothetical protein